MKIIISPSKTKKIQGNPKDSFFDEKSTNILIAHICAMTVSQLGKALKLKEDKAQALMEFYKNFDKEPEGAAIESYNGLVFKNIDWKGLSEKGKAFGIEHLVILSGFYGIVTPMSPVKDYRLDLVDPIYKPLDTKVLCAIYGSQGESLKTLYDFWGDAVNKVMAKEDVIFNLASKEYSSLLTHDSMITIEFLEWKGTQWKQGSTMSKQMRGRMVHYLLDHAVATVEGLPEELDGFVKDTSALAEGLVSYRKK